MPCADDDPSAATDRPDPPWPPRVGEPLPRAQNAYAAPEKLAWILSEEGHGPEWARVLHIGPNDTLRFWNAIAQAAIGARIFKVTESEGTVCGIEAVLIVGERTANARAFWHYEHALGAPRLVTAYPRL